MKNFLTLVFLLSVIISQAQVKIGDNPGTINTNSLLEMESTNKGFLPPRLALNSISSVSPLTGTVPAGMMVYSTAGTLPDGFYYWNGTQWNLLASGDLKAVVKTANATLTKIETFVLASNDITITLPVVTSADNGMEITVKNNGTYTDLITVKGNGAATIDVLSLTTLTRWCGQTFVVYNGNWVAKEKRNSANNLLDVNANSSWTTIEEAVAFLELHMAGPTIIRLGDESYEIEATINVDLDYALTIQGLSYGTATIAAAAGLTNKPMFRCLSDCYFKMVQFDATTLSNYGTLAGEDAIRFVGNGTYNEIKDCTFDRFYNTILDSSDAEIWVFETDISNAQNNGILIHSDQDSVIVKVAETDFIGCKRGINMSKGLKAILQLASGGYYNATATDTSIVYRPSTFTSFISISITGNSWNNTGKFIEGFDFARTDGRDANAIVESNAGMGDKRPNCALSLLNNTTSISLTATNTWYKANWDYTKATFTTCKWTVADAAGGIANVNRITFQPANRKDGYMTITGNILTNANAVINIGVVKNPSGTSSTSITRYGETTLYAYSAINLQFSTVVSLADIAPGDFFEIWFNSTTAAVTLTLSDIQLLVNTQ